MIDCALVAHSVTVAGMYSSRTCGKYDVVDPSDVDEDGRNGFPVREKLPHLERRKSLPLSRPRKPFLEPIILRCSDFKSALELPAIEPLGRDHDARRGGVISVGDTPLDGQAAKTRADGTIVNAASIAGLRRQTGTGKPRPHSPSDDIGRHSPLLSRFRRHSRDGSLITPHVGVGPSEAPSHASPRQISSHGRSFNSPGDHSQQHNRSPKTSRDCSPRMMKFGLSRRSSGQGSPCSTVIDEHSHIVYDVENIEFNQQDKTDNACLRRRVSCSKVRTIDSTGRSHPQITNRRSSLGWEPIVRPSALVSRTTIESLISNSHKSNTSDNETTDHGFAVSSTRVSDRRKSVDDALRFANTRTTGQTSVANAADNKELRQNVYMDKVAKRRLSRQLSMSEVTKHIKQLASDKEYSIPGPVGNVQAIQNNVETKHSDITFETQGIVGASGDDNIEMRPQFVPKQCWCLRCQIMLSMYNVGDTRLDNWGNYPCFRTNLSWKQSNQTAPPVSNQTPPPVSNQTPPPVSNQTPPPVSNQTPPPVSNQTPPPVSNQTPPPVSNQTPPPVSNQTPPPVSNQPDSVVDDSLPTEP